MGANTHQSVCGPDNLFPSLYMQVYNVSVCASMSSDSLSLVKIVDLFWGDSEREYEKVWHYLSVNYTVLLLLLLLLVLSNYDQTMYFSYI